MSEEPPMKIPRRNPALADPALGHRSLKIGSFLTPEEQNANIAMKYGRYKPDDRRTWPLNRDEVTSLYGWEAALRLFPLP